MLGADVLLGFRRFDEFTFDCIKLLIAQLTAFAALGQFFDFALGLQIVQVGATTQASVRNQERSSRCLVSRIAVVF